MNTRSRRKIGLSVATGAASALAVGFLVPPAAADNHVAGYDPDTQQAAVQEITTSQGISPQAAIDILRVQDDSIRTLDRLDAALGDRDAGYYLDAQGKPVVNVLTTADAKQVRQAGAQPKLVEHSAAQLAAARGELESVPAVDHTAIGTDPKTNQVVLTVADAAHAPQLDRLLAAADPLGDAVRVDRIPGGMHTAVLGGEAIEGGGVRCSAGFNAHKGGQNYNVTAGHCTAAVQQWDIGPSVDSNFPGNDHGLIRNTTGQAPGAVTKYNGSTQPINSAQDAKVGEQICKSGSTTQLTCGSVSQVNVTVNYPEGSVHNLTKTDATVDSGDSGGCLFDGSAAVGITSGMDNAGNSFFQPAVEAINAYGVTLN